MAYGTNSPFGLRTYGHLISGVDDIKINSDYTISGNSGSLNKGDPVIYVPQNAQYRGVANGYQGKQSEIMLYNPIVTPAGAGNATTVVGANAVAGQPIVGVFQGCEYYTPNGTWVAQEYWQAGTATNGTPVTALICDDPYVVYDIQLSCYTGALFGALNQFVLLPCLQIQDGSWPDTGGPENTPTIANSRVIGSNITLMTGSNVGANAAANTSATMTGITSWQNGAAAVAGYKDNPLLANQGNAALGGNPWGISTFYACPSLAFTNANPLVTNGSNDYSQAPGAAGNLRVLGFTPNPKNVPATYGQPGNAATAGNYFNTPFLNVLVTINNHANKPGNVGVSVV
jgi:hypothetical protein